MSRSFRAPAKISSFPDKTSVPPCCCSRSPVRSAAPTFRSRNRKQVRKERQTAAAHGLTFRTATGAELDDGDWEALHAFYLANIARHGGIPYLNERFFRVARTTLAVVLLIWPMLAAGAGRIRRALAAGVA